MLRRAAPSCCGVAPLGHPNYSWSNWGNATAASIQTQWGNATARRWLLRRWDCVPSLSQRCRYTCSSRVSAETQQLLTLVLPVAVGGLGCERPGTHPMCAPPTGRKSPGGDSRRGSGAVEGRLARRGEVRTHPSPRRCRGELRGPSAVLAECDASAASRRCGV